MVGLNLFLFFEINDTMIPRYQALVMKIVYTQSFEKGGVLFENNIPNNFLLTM